jgi:hypothetical protein
VGSGSPNPKPNPAVKVRPGLGQIKLKARLHSLKMFVECALDFEQAREAHTYHYHTWGSGPLLHMARVLIPLGKLLVLMLTIIFLVEYYTLKKHQTEIEII